jgi:GNAT superfamily N-acetyltransferase
MIFKDYEIGPIKIQDKLADLQALHARHYAETEVHYKHHQVDVNYEHYIACEARGSFMAFGAQTCDSRQLVAYLFMYIAPSAHDKSTVATADMFYLLPEHRKTGVARQLMRVAEARMKDMGANYMILTDKSPLGAPHLKVLFDSEGYSQIAIAYSKEL